MLLYLKYKKNRKQNVIKVQVNILCINFLFILISYSFDYEDGGVLNV